MLRCLGSRHDHSSPRWVGRSLPSRTSRKAKGFGGTTSTAIVGGERPALGESPLTVPRPGLGLGPCRHAHSDHACEVRAI
jgi:hypothetical protein